MILAMGVSAGIAISKAMVIRKRREKLPSINPDNIKEELQKVDYCIDKTIEEFENMQSYMGGSTNSPAAMMLNKYIKTISNPLLIKDIKQKIIMDRVTAEYAIKCIMDDFKRIIVNLDDEYLYGRSEDIEEIKQRLLNKLVDIDILDCSCISEECIIVAEELTPRDILNINRDYIKGIVTILGCPSSYSSVLARYMKIPAVVGVGYEGLYIKNGDLLIVDGNEGKVIINPDEYELNLYRSAKYKDMIK